MISEPRFILRRGKHELLGFRVQRQLRRLTTAHKFNPGQPRDEQGRWAETGAGEEGKEDAEVIQVAVRRNKQLERDCDEQLRRDIFQCNMVGLRSCYAQAHERYAACLVGRPIPPFNY